MGWLFCEDGKEPQLFHNIGCVEVHLYSEIYKRAWEKCSEEGPNNIWDVDSELFWREVARSSSRANIRHLERWTRFTMTMPDGKEVEIQYDPPERY